MPYPVIREVFVGLVANMDDALLATQFVYLSQRVLVVYRTRGIVG